MGCPGLPLSCRFVLAGLFTKEEYAHQTLRAYQKRQAEMKSEMRDKAAALQILRNSNR